MVLCVMCMECEANNTIHHRHLLFKATSKQLTVDGAAFQLISSHLISFFNLLLLFLTFSCVHYISFCFDFFLLSFAFIAFFASIFLGLCVCCSNSKCMMLFVAFASTSASASRFLFFFSNLLSNRLHSMRWIGAPNFTFYMNEEEKNEFRQDGKYL